MSDIGVRELVGTTPQSSVEVVGVAVRRRFTAAYKRRILDEVGRSGRGEIGLILRREGLYSSQMVNGITKKDGTVLDKGTGLHKDSVIKAVKSLVGRGILRRKKGSHLSGGFGPNEYSLNVQHYPCRKT